MEKEFITKDYFDATFERFEKKFDTFSDLVMESFAYLNVKIDDVEKRLGARIDRVESRLDAIEFRVGVIDTRLNGLSDHVASFAETNVSRVEHKLLKGRVQALENSPATA